MLDISKGLAASATAGLQFVRIILGSLPEIMILIQYLAATSTLEGTCTETFNHSAMAAQEL